MLDMTNDFGVAAPAPQVFDPDNPVPGIYYDVPNELYHSCTKAVSNSMLTQAHDSVSNFAWLKKAPVDIEKLKAFDFGTAVHAMFLEPERYEQEYAVMPGYNMRTNKGKENADAWRKANSDACQIDQADADKVAMMCKSLWADPRASLWRGMPGHAEVVIIWRDERTGLLCKMRADWLVELDDRVIIMDLKSTESMDKYRKDFFKLRYDIQSAFYRTGAEAYFGKSCVFIFAAVSKSVEIGRYPVSVGAVDDADHDIAMEVMRRDMDKLKHAIESDEWIEYDKLERTNSQREYMHEKLSHN